MMFKHVKGLIHLGLTLTAIGELFTATSRTRKILLSSMAGFHAHAALYHFYFEQDTDDSSRPIPSGCCDRLGPMQRLCLTGERKRRKIRP
jgi:hypothetical protein